MPVKALLEQLDQLIQAARSIDLQVTDDPGSLANAATSAPQVQVLLRQSVSLLQKIQVHYDFAAPDDQPVERTDEFLALDLDDIGAIISSEVAAQEIGNLAFMARTKLSEVVEHLVQAEVRDDPLNIVLACESALRQLRRGVLPIETAIYEFEKIDPPVRSWGDQAVALETRRLYAELRRCFSFAPDPTATDIESRLRQIARHLSELRATEVYPALRIDDRLQIRRLSQRITAWLEQPEPDSGLRLWRDLAGFVKLLSQINNRQELREHDRQAIAEAYHTLFEGAPKEIVPDQAVPDQVRERLTQVLGRDDELDRLILEHPQHPVADWQEPLQRLMVDLGHPDLE